VNAQRGDPRRKCGPADTPRKLALDQLIDSAALHQALGAAPGAGEPHEVLLSLRFVPEGVPGAPHVLRSTLDSDSATAIARAVDVLARPQTSTENPWAVRLRITLADRPRVVVERSEYCAPVPEDTPGLQRNTLGPMTGDELRDVMNLRPARGRVLVGDDGSVRMVEIRQSSGSRDFDDALARDVEATRYLPALLDGVAVSVWIALSMSVRRY
jgi:TonB family protein